MRKVILFIGLLAVQWAAGVEILFQDSFNIDSTNINAQLSDRQGGTFVLGYTVPAAPGQSDLYTIEGGPLGHVVYMGNGVSPETMLLADDEGGGALKDFYHELAGTSYQIMANVKVFSSSGDSVDSMGFFLAEGPDDADQKVGFYQLRSRSQVDVIDDLGTTRYDNWANDQWHLVRLEVDEISEPDTYALYVDNVLNQSGTLSFSKNERMFHLKVRDDNGDALAMLDTLIIRLNVEPTSLNVQEIGAALDGVTDDSIAFQSALDRGSDVIVPPGIAKLTTNLYAAENTRILGAGMASTELRWTEASAGISGTGYSVADLKLQSMPNVQDAALHCAGGSFSAERVTIIGSEWTNGIHLVGCTNNVLADLKLVGASENTYSALWLDGDCSSVYGEDIHFQNSEYGVLMNGSPRDVEFNRLTAINNTYSIYIDPDNVASNICIYDLDTQSTRGCLWMNNTVDSLFYSGYCGLKNWDNPLYEGNIHIDGSSSNLIFSGMRMQNNYPIDNTARGILVRNCDGALFVASDIRGMNVGFIANAGAQDITVDGINFYDDVNKNYKLNKSSDVTRIPYQKLQ